MHRIGRLLFVALLFVSGVVVAQSSNSSAPSADSATPKHHRMKGDKAEQRLKRLSKRLDLTDDQKEKLRPILQDEEKQMKAADDDTSLTQQQKHRKTRDIRMASRSQMDSILTDEQKQKLGPAGQHGGGQHHGRHNRSTTATPGSGTTSPDQTSPQ